MASVLPSRMATATALENGQQFAANYIAGPQAGPYRRLLTAALRHRFFDPCDRGRYLLRQSATGTLSSHQPV